jgi:two-component system CheB/CheR fusion protein
VDPALVTRVRATHRRSRALIAESLRLIADSRQLRRPIFRGGSEGFVPTTDLAGVRIVAVDDNNDNVDVFATFLRACGAVVHTAGNGNEALGFLVSHEVDVVLTDLAMPGINGIDLVRRLRADPAHAAIPAIAVSGFPEKYFADDARHFMAFLLKPVELETLAAVVKQVVLSYRNGRT